MVAVFFIYGLAFFALGFAVAVYPKKDSEFKLAEHLYLIGGFGLLHGVNEWLDMFLLIEPFSESRALVLVRAFTLPVSFIFMVQFGARAIAANRPGAGALRFAAPVLWVIWLAVFLVGERNFTTWDIWSRYLLCTPGAALTGLALAMQLPEVRKARSAGITAGLKIASGSFFLYAILAGLVVRGAEFFPASVFNYARFAEYAGVPVQVFRSACAIAMAYGIIRALSIFYWEARDRIRQSDLRFRAVAGEAPVIFFTADGGGVITFAEGRSMSALELPREAVVGRHLEEVFGDASSFVDGFRGVIEGNEAVLTVETGGRFFEMFLGPMHDAGGENAGLVGVAVDITSQVASERERDEYRREMSRMRQMATLGTLSERMARQIEEPLGVACVFMQRVLIGLRERASTEEVSMNAREGLGKIKEAEGIIHTFYATAEITPPDAAAPLDLKETAQKIITVFGEVAERAGMELGTAGMDVLPYVRISPRELEQVFFILVQNAIDAAAPGCKNKLMISAQIDRGRFLLRFIDNCGGISPEMLEQIFEPFVKPEGRVKDSGLGLAVAKRIVEAYGGEIKVESEAGRGTTFEVVLPNEGIY